MTDIFCWTLVSVMTCSVIFISYDTASSNQDGCEKAMKHIVINLLIALSVVGLRALFTEIPQ